MKKKLSNLTKNIKIHFIKEAIFTRIVIFDTIKFYKNLEKQELTKLNPFYRTNKESAILGSIVIEKNPKEMCWGTVSIAAEHGYGPLLYELAMTDIFPNFLTSDTPDRVSDEAKTIWDKFYLRKDVTKIPKESYKSIINILENSKPKDKVKYSLFYQYSLNKPLNYQKHLVGKQFTKQMSSSRFNLDQILSDMASNYFIENYILPD